MNQKIQAVAGALLGLLFITFGLNFFLQFLTMPSPPEGTPMAAFMGAMYGSGYLAFVKVLEIGGGILVAIPLTRKIGLLILTPIIVNILAIHIFLMGGAGLFEPPVVMITALAAYLLVSSGKAIANLIG